MKKTGSLALIVIAAFCLLAGCGKEQQIEPIKQICLAGTTKAEAVKAAEDVLGEMYFAIDKSDVESGYIKSRPLRGGQFFEFWRKDNVGGFNNAEANLHTIRRTVEINIGRQAEELCLECDVKIERLSLSDRSIDRSGQKYDRSARVKTSLEKLEIKSKQKSWIELDKDEKLSTVILEKIREKLVNP